MKKHRFLWTILLLVALIAGSSYGSLKKVQKEKIYSGRTEVIEKLSYDEFTTEIIDLIKKYDGDKIDEAALSSPYYSRRLIVQGIEDNLDLTMYKAKVIVCGPDNMYVMQFDSQENTKAAYNELQELSIIEYCEPDQYIKTLEDGGEYEAMSWGVRQIGADNYAQYVRNTTEGSIVVAVVDTGIYEHPFLKGRIAAGGMDFVNNDSIPDDRNSHGTHVAGTIVDCTPDLNISILPVKVLGTNGFGSWLRISLGIKYAANQGAQIMNLSLGGGISNTVDNAVTYAMNQGCTVVVAAGNDNKDTANCSPAHIDKCMVVSAVDSSLQKADFSNWGESIDVAAPGVNVISCVPSLLFGKIVGNAEKSMNGTSMATPHIAALAAMIKLKNPSLTSDEIINTITNNCVDLGDAGWDAYYGWGIPDFNNNTDISVSPIDKSVQTDIPSTYEDILEEYKKLAESNFDSSLLEQARYVNEGVWNFCGQEQYSVYYRIIDIAGDGNPELIISVNEKEAPENIVDIYGMENGKTVRLIESNSSVGYRSRYYISIDNRIKNVTSGGALDSRISYYVLPTDSVFLELEEQYIYSGDMYTHIDRDDVSTHISKEEYAHFSSEEDVDFESTWELLYEGQFFHYVE